MTTLRPQFSMRSMLIAVAVVSIFLGITAFIDPRVYWRDLWFFVYVATWGMLTWLIIVGPWSARIFAIACLAGALVESVVMDLWLENELVQFALGTWSPEGWYPLSLPILRLLVHLGWQTPQDSILAATFAGPALSGIVAGLLAMAVYWPVSFFARRHAHVQRESSLAEIRID